MDNNIISVIGSGTMGNGIAHVFAMSSDVQQVFLVDLDDKILEKAQSLIRKNLDRQVKKEIISDLDSNKFYNKIIFTTDINNASSSDLVIEAVKEDVVIKKNIFNKLSIITSNNTILATNTSSISIGEIAKATKNPENVIGMHFMNPVPVMKLVEIIKGDKTNNSIVKRTLDYVSSIGKIAVECNDSPGFVSNRILMPMINEAAYTYMEGVATADAIDQIMKLGMGHPMGPLKLADLIGIDVCVYIIDVLFEGFKIDKYKVCPLLKEMVDQGKLGIKSGEGFYKY
jgi:3-hydroxybutyryl-CoA dehydrogenase